MTHKEKCKKAIYDAAYQRGIDAHKEGKPDVNPYSVGDIMEMCAWSAGYFDAKRGMV